MKNTLSSYNNKVLPLREGQTDFSINGIHISKNDLPEILVITSFPPRECGIATYSQDLIKALNNKFSHSFNIKVCALESDNEKHSYSDEVEYILNTDQPHVFTKLAKKINENDRIAMVLIQHEFGFFVKRENSFQYFLRALTKPVAIVFHTVLPHPDAVLKAKITEIASVAQSIIVMTNSSSRILVSDYSVPQHKITVIPHGTHLVPHSDKDALKHKYELTGKKVLTTFGLLSSGKSIETTLEALPAIIKENPEVMFLIIGKTHPSVVKEEGYKYRNFLDSIVTKLNLQDHVRYINYYLPLNELLEYLQLTDIYLFTSKDRNQAVSGTFSYALSCGCPIISTPIPHAVEVLKNDAGIIFDFENSEQLGMDVNRLLSDEPLRINMSLNALHKIAPTAWENSAIAHAILFEKIVDSSIPLQYNIPAINLDHIKRLTTDFGMIQFSKINQPDIDTGYTLDDNARALVAICQHFEITKDEADLPYIHIYFNFLKFCLQQRGNFLNYVTKENDFSEQNNETNLEDSNGRAIWALGYLISLSGTLPCELMIDAKLTMQSALQHAHKIHSSRAMAFIIKGLYYSTTNHASESAVLLIKELADRLVQMYRHESEQKWQWFESYLTYANSILPEAMLCAWLSTGELIYKEIAKSSFDFLLEKIFTAYSIKVISNKGWLYKQNETVEMIIGGEQPIDVAYSIMALSKFYDVFDEEEYLTKMKTAFSWFLGNNHLQQIIYNPCTGGCYDGLEEDYINLNQGAESTVSYLMARLTMEKYTYPDHTINKKSWLTARKKDQFYGLFPAAPIAKVQISE